MANGYPINDAASAYDPLDPYADRDPRLLEYIVVNGSQLGSSAIQTETGSGDDAIDNLPTSTRTGYYMRKLLRNDVNVNPVSEQQALHYVPRIRYTEIFLIYAEAANEAWGPDGTGTVASYTARDVIAAIRNRARASAGITDEYISTVSSQEEMRELIRNERRLELCFEGFRFWDLRRWSVPSSPLEELNEPAMGVRITNDQYEIISVENRLYQDHMIYGPLPYNDVVKAGLIQNNGW